MSADKSHECKRLITQLLLHNRIEKEDLRINIQLHSTNNTLFNESFTKFNLNVELKLRSESLCDLQSARASVWYPVYALFRSRKTSTRNMIMNL